MQGHPQDGGGGGEEWWQAVEQGAGLVKVQWVCVRSNPGPKHESSNYDGYPQCTTKVQKKSSGKVDKEAPPKKPNDAE